jgi:hypothetical protein
MRSGAVYDCPFVPSEALRFLTAPLWQGVAVRNRNASADRAVRVRARACARVRSRVPSVEGRKCARACVCLCVCVPPFSTLTVAPRHSSNQIGDDGAAALASSLEGLTALKLLWLE